ncbi:Gfo/Idh/MocA family oxidoreductase [Halobacillus sp. Cin3]|uniref:Gfo/Idh/MocA family oxidoreductase n=1 Tax=Halobacillus sp. Cin3 TaxID=2928441 RepID=UPI00248EB454|nr:Gfo/Idh/MocA family oxidoreductase [Halobacillus sp. Cin3]
MSDLRIGVVGLGRLGSRHAENILNIPGCELTAVCATTAEKVKQYQEKWAVPFGYTDTLRMFKEGGLDAVVIASSSSEHCQQVLDALESGLHVFCEKPLGLTLEECIQVREKAEEFPEQCLMLGFMRRFDPSYQFMKKQILGGRIGTPILIRCYSLDPEYLIDGLLRFAETSGGLFVDMGVHDIDLARWLLESEVEQVYALGGCYLYDELKVHGDMDNAAALMTFEKRAIGQFYSGRTASHGYHIETEVVGTKGTLRLSPVPAKNQVMLFNEQGAVEECVYDFLERFEVAFKQEMQAFIQGVQTGEKLYPDAGDGVKATQAALKAVESVNSGMVVR